MCCSGAFEKDSLSDHALRVWISEDGNEYHLWTSEDFGGDRRGVEQYFVREGLTSVEDALKSLHEDIEAYLEVLS